MLSQVKAVQAARLRPSEIQRRLTPSRLSRQASLASASGPPSAASSAASTPTGACRPPPFFATPSRLRLERGSSASELSQGESADEEGQQQQEQQQLGPVELGRLLAAFHATSPAAPPPRPQPLQQSPPEELLAEEGLPGGEWRLELESSSRAGDLRLRWARYWQRFASLAGQRVHVLRAVWMPVLHYWLALTGQQVVWVFDELSFRRDQPQLPEAHVDHSEPLSWHRAQDSGALDLQHTGPLDA